MSIVIKSHLILCSLLRLINKPRLYLNRIFFILLISVVLFSCKTEKHNRNPAKIKIALREVGNQLLLKTGDSTSLILPVLALDASVYQFEFEELLSFEPNDLVSAIDSSFNVAELTKNYRVEVLQSTDNEVAYSFEKNIEKKRTIIPCSGRVLPKADYEIKITFLSEHDQSSSYTWLLYVVGLSLLFFIFRNFLKKPKAEITSKNINNSFQKLGVFQFYPEQNKLVKAATEISLSKKECELLAIFVASPNQIIKRDELTKRVWEDNGVFVGRSLDTYISKLRKKLQDDDSIKLTNVHGVGYKLEIA